MAEKWSHRADLAEDAVDERHAERVWQLPRTNLAAPGWPPTAKERVLWRWHYWWQAHYLDCLVDAYERRGTRTRRARLRDTVRGIRVRNLRPLTTNRYYDDKAWLALALHRADDAAGFRLTRKLIEPLDNNIIQGVDSLTGVVPWREGEAFYNVPANGPAAILMARTGRLAEARRIADWILDHLINENGLVMDGMRMRMHGPEYERAIYSYNQGLVIGLCLEIIVQLRDAAGVGPEEELRPELGEEVMPYVMAIRTVVRALASEMATPQGVINEPTDGGDGGLFKGILARYLADMAVRMPSDTRVNRAVKKVAARLVTVSAESVWNHRLEVDGLPVFAREWTEDAVLPHNYGLGSRSLAESAGMVRVAERDLSVQLSGWMLMEAAARLEQEETAVSGRNPRTQAGG